MPPHKASSRLCPTSETEGACLKKAMGNGQWAMGNGQWAMGKNKREEEEENPWGATA